MNRDSPIYFLDNDAQLEPDGGVMLLKLLSGEQLFTFAMSRHMARLLVEIGARALDRLEAVDTLLHFPMQPEPQPV